MDVSLVIKQRLEDLKLDQKALAAAAEVTESYISQLLTRKKLPPTPERTDLYDKIEKFLKLPSGRLSKLADNQRKEELKRSLTDPPKPLLTEVRETILRKCVRDKEKQIAAIFEKQPFGELERLVTQKLLDVVQRVAREELKNEKWLQLVARLVGRSYQQMRVSVLDFLDTDIFNISVKDCDTFLDPLIESWDIDLATFAMEIVLNRRLAHGSPKRLEFVEREAEPPTQEVAGFKRFVRDRVLSGDATAEELKFLERLRFDGKQPTALYYYRELQNLRDPLHFRLPMSPSRGHGKPRHSRSEKSVAPMHKNREAGAIEKQMQTHNRKRAVERWKTNEGQRDKK